MGKICEREGDRLADGAIFKGARGCAAAVGGAGSTAVAVFAGVDDAVAAEGGVFGHDGHWLLGFRRLYVEIGLREG